LGEAFVASLGPAILDRNSATFIPTNLAESLHKRSDPFASGRTRALAQEADGRQLPPLLRARRSTRPPARGATIGSGYLLARRWSCRSSPSASLAGSATCGVAR